MGYYNSARAEVFDFVPSGAKKVLEIGCGEGSFRKNFGDIEYWGVEPNVAAASVAINSLTHVIVGNFEDVQQKLPNEYFDLIVCNDVIEHMMDHDSFFLAIREKLATGGNIIGSVPNIRFVDNFIELIFYKDWRYTDDGVMDRTHLRFFTEKSLKCSLLNAGFKIKGIFKINYHDASLRSKKKLRRLIFSALFGRDTLYKQFVFLVKQ